MSLDRTLKTHGGLTRMRSVLTRAERIGILTEEGKFDPEKNSPFGLAKVRVRHSKAGTKTKKVAEEAPAAAEGAPGEGAAAPAAAAAAPERDKGKEKAAKAPEKAKGKG